MSTSVPLPRLLIVDDEASIHHAFQRAFRGQDLEILTAMSASSAEQITREQQPDAIVLDLHLPDATGLSC